MREKEDGKGKVKSRSKDKESRGREDFSIYIPSFMHTYKILLGSYFYVIGISYEKTHFTWKI